VMVGAEAQDVAFNVRSSFTQRMNVCRLCIEPV
jgi:hypothetical protein